MAMYINGTTGISGVDGSAGTPAVQGTDTNTGVYFGADTVYIATGGTVAQTVDSGQRTKFPTTIGVGGATPSTSGSGVSFPATQSASTDANTLDDYEEGTWTPSLGGNTTYTEQGGYYTKIGNQVIAGFTIIVNAIGTGSTTAVSGLPFSTTSTTYLKGGYVTLFDTVTTSIVFPVLHIPTSSTTITVYSSTAAGTSNVTANSIFKNGARLTGIVIYQT